MRRLTLILSDLYLPVDVVKESFPTALSMPSLDWLLRFSRVERIDDWRRWLARDIGADAFADLPLAQACAFDRAQGGAPRGSWLATPVFLEARLDHVRLADRGLLRMAPDERSAWRAEFSTSFGPEISLLDAGERSFLLQGGPNSVAPSLDPARLLDADIGKALPVGPDSRELRRLGIEIEMWLHAAKTNAARERAKLRPVSALWLWGGGERADASPQPVASNPVRIFGGDPYLPALARVALDSEKFRASIEPAPRSYQDLGEGADAYVELTPMSGPDESLAELERTWLVPVRRDLSTGVLDAFSLVANDRAFHLRRKPAWKFWRRRRGWLESLA